MPVVTAVVLAGGRPDPALTGAPLPKAFAPLRERTMVEFVLDALRGVAGIGPIVIVAPRVLPPGIATTADVVVEERGGLLENVDAGLAAVAPDSLALVVAADIPLLTSKAVAAFLERALALNADVAYGVVSKADVTSAYPSARKTFVRLRDGVFTGGNLVLMRQEGFTRVRPVLARAIAARKRPWDLARLFGPATLFGLATGRLEISALEARAAQIVGIRARAVICHEPEIALDVDRGEDLAVMEGWLIARDAAHPLAAEEGPQR